MWDDDPAEPDEPGEVAAPQEKSLRGDTRDTGDTADPAHLSPRGDTRGTGDLGGAGEVGDSALPAEGAAPAKKSPRGYSVQSVFRGRVIQIFDGIDALVPKKSPRRDSSEPLSEVEKAIQQKLEGLA